MKGMLVMDYFDRYPQAGAEMAAWMAAGKLKSREDIVEGLETFPETLLKLFKGENIGKLMLKVECIARGDTSRMPFVENQGTKIYWDEQGQGT